MEQTQRISLERNRPIVLIMDGIKEILDALNTRIRSPIFGSITIAFIFTNWKPLFYLAFSDSTVSTKFTYFDTSTTIWSLIAIPLALGLILAVASPWITLFSSQVAEFPTSKRKLLQVDSIHKSLLRKQELEQTRKQILAETEIGLIKAAKRDEEIQKIGDPKIRENLQKQIDDLREIAVTVTPPDENPASEIIFREKVKQLEYKLKMYRDERDSALKKGDFDRVETLDAVINETIEELTKLQASR
jgi:hypothetical protein